MNYEIFNEAVDLDSLYTPPAEPAPPEPSVHSPLPISAYSVFNDEAIFDALPEHSLQDFQASEAEVEPSAPAPSTARNWNEEFAVAQGLPEQTFSQLRVKYQQISSIIGEFLDAVREYGRIIIAEVSLPAEEKTIKPVNVGGVAGGSKFLHWYDSCLTCM